MREATIRNGTDRRPRASEREDNEITQPIRIICCTEGGARRISHAWLLRKNGVPEPRLTPDYTEIGDPAA